MCADYVAVALDGPRCGESLYSHDVRTIYVETDSEYGKYRYTKLGWRYQILVDKSFKV